MKLGMWKISSLLFAAFILFCAPLRAATSSFIGPMHQI
jgi:hypothetical protein